MKKFVLAKEQMNATEAVKYAGLCYSVSVNSRDNGGASRVLRPGMRARLGPRRKKSCANPELRSTPQSASEGGPSKPQSMNAKDMRCVYCKEIGHKKSECAKLKQVGGRMGPIGVN